MILTIDRHSERGQVPKHRAPAPKYGSVSKDPKIVSCRSRLDLKMFLEIATILIEIVYIYASALTMEGCEQGWKFYKHLCYQMSSDPYKTLTHQEARAVCLAKGADLTSVWDNLERDFIAQELLNAGSEDGAWIGLRQEKRGNKYVWIWVDGSPADVASWKYGTTDENSGLCGIFRPDGSQDLLNCTDTLRTFVCKKNLKMWYVVSDVFENVYRDEDFSKEPQKLLFERVWPPKVEKVYDYLKHLAQTAVSKETDCAYKCFRADACRAFSVQCKVNWKCEKYDCDVYRPNVI